MEMSFYPEAVEVTLTVSRLLGHSEARVWEKQCMTTTKNVANPDVQLIPLSPAPAAIWFLL